MNASGEPLCSCDIETTFQNSLLPILIPLKYAPGSSAFVTSEIDIYRAANILVKRYGEDAALEAAQRADVMLERGDIGHQRHKPSRPDGLIQPSLSMGYSRISPSQSPCQD